MLLGFKFKRLKLKKNRNLAIESSIIEQLKWWFLLLITLIAIHTLIMIFAENLSLGDAIWLTMTSVTTVGYGDLSAKTAIGRISTIILLYLGGIAILAQVASMYFEYRQEIRARILQGDWSWNMENHIVFINCPSNVGEEYFSKSISGLRNSSSKLASTPIVIVCEKMSNGISNNLRKMNVTHVAKSINQPEAFEYSNIHKAHTVIILSKDYLDSISDSINFELVDRLRNMGVKSRIIVESVNDENRARLKRIGADSVLRPIRAYPELLMRSIIAPGSEEVIETLFNSYGEECVKIEVTIEDKWLNIIEKLTKNEIAIPIAYEDLQGNIINSPKFSEVINVKSLYVIVNKDDFVKSDKIKDLF